MIRRLSDLAKESLRDPGNWRCLEMVYRNQPTKLLDRFFLGSRAARGARSRLRVLQDEICNAIERCAGLRSPIRLVNFGSGPGHEVLACVERLRDRVAVEAICIDRDPLALEYGRSLADSMGLNGRVSYRRGNVLRLDFAIRGHDVGILSGLLDYFDSETAVSVLRKVRESLLPGGAVLIANMRRHGLASVMNVLGNWPLVYREPEEVEELLAESGYEQTKVWLEPEKVFCIGTGVRSS